ncbi:MAG TPA: HlyD family efflux transporter periplasmic adaptor subunit [Thermoanaerobaculia bacterium]|nr:HlyD family efflux transporter periplasmic adaptor subunit [Thermoanaerobaculia bacterium]
MKAVLAALSALLVAACFSGHAETSPEAPLHVRRGTFTSDVLLSGEVEAARGDYLTVPRLPSWQTAIKWLADDGEPVKAGQPVVELDNSSLTADLETRRQTAMQTAQELQQSEAQWEADLQQHRLDADKRRSELDKAQIEAAVPRDIVSERVFEEKQSALRRATIEHEKAVDLLASRRTAIEAERRNLRLRIEKAEREIAIAEEAITALVLRAPRDGIVVVRDHPWEGRKFQVGDPAHVGMVVAMLPDLSSLRVKAALADVDDGRIAAGMAATVVLDGFPDLPFSARIASISAVAQESRRQSLRRHFDVMVTLDALDRERMRPGLSARIVVRNAMQPSVLLAPRAALDFSGNAPRARLANGSTREVTLGACNAQDCIVTKGLQESEQLARVVEVRGRA